MKLSLMLCMFRHKLFFAVKYFQQNQFFFLRKKWFFWKYFSIFGYLPCMKKLQTAKNDRWQNSSDCGRNPAALAKFRRRSTRFRFVRIWHNAAGFLPVLVVLAKFIGIRLLLPNFGDEAEIQCKMILAMLVGIQCKLLNFGTGWPDFNDSDYNSGAITAKFWCLDPKIRKHSAQIWAANKL